MKHNFSFLPSLRRTTLLALLCLGIMPMWADNVITVAFYGNGNRNLYMHDTDSALVAYDGSSSENVSKWRKIPADEIVTFDSKPYTVYYLQNVSTGKYLYAGDPHTNTGNSDWYYRVTKTGDKSTDDLYKWFIMPKDGNWVIFNKGCGITTESSGAHTYHLHSCNQYNPEDLSPNAPKPQVICGRSGDINDYCKPGIAESWASTPACTIPNGTTIYVDVTNFSVGREGDGHYYLTIVGNENNAKRDLCQDAASYQPGSDQWITMEQVDGNIYKAKITTNEKNSSLICIWNKDIHTWNNPNANNVAGMTAYDCTTGNNLYTINEDYVEGSSQGLYIFTGTWSSYTPVDPCPNCGTVPAK